MRGLSRGIRRGIGVRRLPLESDAPLFAFAVIRLAIAVGALVLAIALGLPYEGRLAVVLAATAVPWSAVMLFLSRRHPTVAMNPLVAAGDVAVLLAIELAVPESYGAVRFTALFLVAVHAHFQGERGGFGIAAATAVVLIVGTALRDAGAVRGDILAFYEAAFGTAAVGTGLIVGRLRTTESASRLQARGLSRRMIEAEREVRRRVADSIHDGPVQELIGLDMVLTAARRASDGGDSSRLPELLDEAHQITERNVQALRDEIVDLGPYAFDELDYPEAVRRCCPTWQRRYGIEILLTIEPLELPADVCADLFHITQEAVANAGRHADPGTVSISLRTVDGEVELRVADDGSGFREADPLAAGEPGHLGLASMRERAELLGGGLSIESGERGTKVVVRLPLPRRRARSSRARWR